MFILSSNYNSLKIFLYKLTKANIFKFLYSSFNLIDYGNKLNSFTLQKYLEYNQTKCN